MVTKLPSVMLMWLLSLLWSSHNTALGLHAFYDSIMSGMRSLAPLNLPITRYQGDFDISILLEKLPEKLLIRVLKEYPTIDQIIEMIKKMKLKGLNKFP